MKTNNKKLIVRLLALIGTLAVMGIGTILAKRSTTEEPIGNEPAVVNLPGILKPKETVIFETRTAAGDIFGTFQIINRETLEQDEFTVERGEIAHTLTLAVGAYAIFPNAGWREEEGYRCTTEENGTLYDTRCNWEGTDPPIFIVREEERLHVRARFWVATADDQKGQCGIDHGCAWDYSICAVGTEGLACQVLCGTDPITLQRYHGCGPKWECTKLASGHSACLPAPYRKPISNN